MFGGEDIAALLLKLYVFVQSIDSLRRCLAPQIVDIGKRVVGNNEDLAKHVECPQIGRGHIASTRAIGHEVVSEGVPKHLI